jgi:hypothetical protein
VLLVLVALAVGLLPVFFLVSWVWWQRRHDTRRSPLTDELMHLPGEQAQREADRLMDVADERMLIAVLIGPMILAIWALQKVDVRSFHFGVTEAVLLLSVLIVGGWTTWSAAKVLRARRKYLEGRAAERKTGVRVDFREDLRYRPAAFSGGRSSPGRLCGPAASRSLSRDLGRIDECIGSGAACACRAGGRLAARIFPRVVGLVATPARCATLAAHR